MVQLCRLNPYTNRERHFDAATETPLLLDRHLLDDALCSAYSSRYISTASSSVRHRWESISDVARRANGNHDSWITRGEMMSLRQAQNVNSTALAASYHAVEVQPRSFAMNELSEAQFSTLQAVLREYQSRWRTFATQHSDQMQEMGLDPAHWENQITLYGLPLQTGAQDDFLRRAQTCQFTHEEAAAVHLLLNLPAVNGVGQLSGNAPLTPEEMYNFYELAQFAYAGRESFHDMPFHWNESQGMSLFLAGENREVSLREACLPHFMASSQVSAIRQYIEAHGEWRIAIESAKRFLVNQTSAPSLMLLGGLMIWHVRAERSFFERALRNRCPGANPEEAWRDFLQHRTERIQQRQQLHPYIYSTILNNGMRGLFIQGLASIYGIDPALHAAQRRLHYPPLLNTFLMVGLFSYLQYASRIPYSDFINNRCPETQATPETHPAPVPEATPERSPAIRPEQVNDTSVRNALAASLGITAASAFLARHGPAIMSALRTIASGAATLSEITALGAEVTVGLALTLAGLGMQARCAQERNHPPQPGEYRFACPSDLNQDPNAVYK